jgi:CheY-like chemotaxis protein
MLLNTLRRILETDGHEVDTANGGQAGIETFRESLRGGKRYDAVITDLGMPHVDGSKVAAAIKADSPATPVIMLTGWGKRLIAENDMPANVDKVIGKPPRLADLRLAVAELCQGEAR